ncbi:MAG: Gfo/Idh/MocA family oxidoreductase [Phycisphaerae bacterium]|nr:Gfo/Idh/MocA family oxidoreductase [Phycisphaerae bacterium]
MSKRTAIHRRQFLRRSLATAGAAVALPHFVASSVLGKGGVVAPSDRIILGAMGVGNRGSYDLGCILREPDVRVVAIADVQAARRRRAKGMVDGRYKNKDCVTYRDFRKMFARKDIDALLIATGPNWHVTAAIMAAKAGKDVYCEKPCTKNIAQSLELAATYQRTGRVFQGGMQRRNMPHFAFAVELAHTGRLGKLTAVHAHPGGMRTATSGWMPAEKEPPKEVVDWDLYLGPAAWRPYNRRLMNGFNFEKGGGLVGGGILEWGSHCVDQCQWANQADRTAPVEYWPIENGQATAKYANGVKLVIRGGGWGKLGSCPARFEGTKGWVETGDNGDINASSPELLVGRGAKIRGYPANNHLRDFFNCVKTRGLPRANHFASCWTHIACHAANIAIFLKRKLTYDPKKNEFIGDKEANRLRSEALREPWRL